VAAARDAVRTLVPFCQAPPSSTRHAGSFLLAYEPSRRTRGRTGGRRGLPTAAAAAAATAAADRRGSRGGDGAWGGSRRRWWRWWRWRRRRRGRRRGRGPASAAAAFCSLSHGGYNAGRGFGVGAEAVVLPDVYYLSDTGPHCH